MGILAKQDTRQTGNNMQIQKIIRTFTRMWPLVILFTLSGTLAAYIYAASNPPLYEGYIIADFGLYLDEEVVFNERSRDLAEGKVQRLILSEEVINSALASLQNSPDSAAQAAEENFLQEIYLERRLSEWRLKARGENLTFLEEFMPAWGKTASEAFDTAYQHALAAGEIRSELLLLNGDLALMAVSGKPEAEAADILDTLTNRQSELIENLALEIKASLGISTYMTLTVHPEAVINKQPITRDRAELLAAGTAAGLFLSLLILTFLASRRSEAAASYNEGSVPVNDPQGMDGHK